MDQNGGDGTAVHTATVNAKQKSNGGNQIHAERERDQKRYTHRRRHAGNRPKKDTAQSTDQGHQNNFEIRKYRSITGNQKIKIHVLSPL